MNNYIAGVVAVFRVVPFPRLDVALGADTGGGRGCGLVTGGVVIGGGRGRGLVTEGGSGPVPVGGKVLDSTSLSSVPAFLSQGVLN